MSAELLYTSAPQGLKSGSRGFCTVVSTAGMPINLATRLEALSAYRHVFAPQDPSARLNPIGYSHVKVNVGGRPLSILSRSAAYGVDYSQRTNKLVHHVVLEPDERGECGPAALLQSSGLFKNEWDGNCRTPATGPSIPAPIVTPDVCRKWEAIQGDAGWAGVVAECFADPTAKPLWIVFSVEQSELLLPLIAESVALLPPWQRWNATFSTYFTNLPPDVDCKVRCVLAGTDEARLAPARGVVLELGEKRNLAAKGVYVIAARNGTLPVNEPAVPIAGPYAATADNPASKPLSGGGNSASVAQNPAIRPDASSVGKPLKLMPPNTIPVSIPINSPPGVGRPVPRRRLPWALIISGATATLGLIAVAALLALNTRSLSETRQELAENGTQNINDPPDHTDSSLERDSASKVPIAEPQLKPVLPSPSVEKSDGITLTLNLNRIEAKEGDVVKIQGKAEGRSKIHVKAAHPDFKASDISVDPNNPSFVLEGFAPVVPGEYEIKVVAENNSGSEEIQSLLLNVLDVPPEIEISAFDGRFDINGSLSLAGKWNQQACDKSLEISISIESTNESGQWRKLDLQQPPKARSNQTWAVIMPGSLLAGASQLRVRTEDGETKADVVTNAIKLEPKRARADLDIGVLAKRRVELDVELDMEFEQQPKNYTIGDETQTRTLNRIAGKIVDPSSRLQFTVIDGELSDGKMKLRIAFDDAEDSPPSFAPLFGVPEMLKEVESRLVELKNATAKARHDIDGFVPSSKPADQMDAIAVQSASAKFPPETFIKRLSTPKVHQLIQSLDAAQSTLAKISSTVNEAINALGGVVVNDSKQSIKQIKADLDNCKGLAGECTQILDAIKRRVGEVNHKTIDIPVGLKLWSYPDGKRVIEKELSTLFITVYSL